MNAHRLAPHPLGPILLSLLLTLGACSDDSSPLDSGPTPDHGSALDGLLADGGPDGAVVDQGPQPDAAPTAKICGTLLDEAGAAIADGNVSACNDKVCVFGEVGAGGSFCISVPEADPYLFHARELERSGGNLGDMLFPVTVTQADMDTGAVVDVGQVVQPKLGTSLTLDPAVGGTLDLGGGAQVVVPANVAQLPLLMSEAKVALAVLDPSKLHAKLLATVPVGQAPAAAFLITPVGVTFSSPVAFTLPLSSAPASGTSYELRVVNHELPKVEPAGSATADSSGNLVQPASGGLTSLGLLLVLPK